MLLFLETKRHPHQAARAACEGEVITGIVSVTNGWHADDDYVTVRCVRIFVFSVCNVTRAFVRKKSFILLCSSCACCFCFLFFLSSSGWVNIKFLSSHHICLLGSFFVACMGTF